LKGLNKDKKHVNSEQSQQPGWMHLDGVGAKGREVHRLEALQRIGCFLELKPVRTETQTTVGRWV